MRKTTKKQIGISAAVLIFAVAVLIVVSAAQRDAKIEPVPTVDISSAGIDINQVPVRLIAHRGLSGVAPENTKLAIERAGRESFTAVSFDIRETLDGVWALMHDNTVNRMTNGRGKIKDFTYFELLNFTVDNGANVEEYADGKIAELEEMLDFCAQFGMRPYINIKQGSAEGLAKLAAILAQRQGEQNCAVLSCDQAYLSTIKKLAPTTELWFIAPELTKQKLKWIEENEWAGVAFDAENKTNTDDKIKTLIQGEKQLACLGVKDPQTVKRMVAIGVMDFHTDSILPK
ncbi:MAG: hypothetical protein GXZ02_03245 [Clostridiales bacterium]|nr:hypothetical protein [Clostridiales bacterium]